MVIKNKVDQNLKHINVNGLMIMIKKWHFMDMI